MVSGITTIEVLEYLIEKVNLFSLFELVPLCSFIALNLGDDEVANFISRLRSHPLSVVPRFWLATLAIHSMVDIRLKVFNFILSTINNAWRDFVQALEIVCRANGINSKPLIHEFLMLLTNVVNSQELVCQEVDELLQLASWHILFQPIYRRPALERFIATQWP
jgi:hypothetical protein